jgi:hypothetical protein
VYFASGDGVYRARTDGTGHDLVLSGLGGGYTYWSLSPDGTRLAYTAYTLVFGKNVVAVANADGSARRQITQAYGAADPAGCYAPVWSPDGLEVVMHCYPGPGAAIGIYRAGADVAAPVAPTHIGGQFRSRVPELAGQRPPS